MSAGINAKASIDGAKKFQDDLKAMTARSKALDAEMKEMTNRFEKDGKAMGDDAKQRELATKQIEAQKQKIALLSGELKKLEAAGQGESAQAYKLREQLAKANTELTNMEHATDGAASKSASFTSGLGKMAIGAGAAVVAVKAAVGAIKSIASAATSAAKAVWNLGVEQGQWADALITQSNQTGVDTTTLQEWGYAARFIDTEVSTMTNGMKKLTKAYAKGTSSKKKAVKVAKGVTVSLKKENGELKSQTEFYYDVIDSLHGMTNIAQRNAAAQQIFGKSYTDMLPLIESGTSALRAYGQEAHEMGVIISADNVNALGKFDDTMQRFNATTEAIKTNLAVAFLPVLEIVAGKLTEFSGKVSGILSDGLQKEDVGKIVDAFFEMFSLDSGDEGSEGQSAVSFIGELVSLLASKVAEHGDDIKAIAKTVLDFVADGFKEAVGLTGLKEKIFGKEGTFLGFEIEEGSLAETVVGKIKRVFAILSGDFQLSTVEKRYGGTMEDNIGEGMTENQGPVADAADDTVDTVEEHAGGPRAHSRSTHWGQELAEGYAAGIDAGIPQVRAAGERMARAAAAPIHFSKPDYGPLRQIGEWGGEMIDQYVGGIKRNLYKVDAVMGGAVNAATMGGRTTNYGGVSINVYGAAGQDVNALADIVMERMQSAVNRREAVFA